jgi:succinate dehydrogenase/fumarate reductase flavoprotein subunit
MAGLCAAVRALEAGADVILLDKAPRLGGTTVLSGGRIWTFAEFDRLKEAIPDGDEVLQRSVFAALDAGFAWLGEQGVELGPEEPALGHGRGRHMAPLQAVPTLLQRVESLGGIVATDTAVDELVLDNGAVTGLRAVSGDSSIELRGSAVILATGGFQGNPELVARYITSPDSLYLRANPWSTGDGFLAATQAGAAVSPALDTFYGHALVAPPGNFDQNHFVDAGQYYGPNGVALNLSGMRFTDESEGTGEEVLNQRLARQPHGEAFYVIDAAIASTFATGQLLTSVIVEKARMYGAQVVFADTIEGLADGLRLHGLPAPNVIRTLKSYNHALENSQAADLDPGRKGRHFPLVHPPLQAVRVKAGITFTMGGLAVDERMRVLRRSATSSPMAQSITDIRDFRIAPIPGLFAAGCDVGNLSHLSYMGSLAPALTTGLVAGREAARIALALAPKG